MLSVGERYACVRKTHFKGLLSAVLNIFERGN